MFRTSRKVLGEEDMEEALKDADIIAADPLYRPICSKNVSSMNFHIWHFPEEFQEKSMEKIRRLLEVIKSMKTWKKSEKNKLSLIEKLLYY